MEIQEIKANLKISTILSHYGIALPKTNRINCPFHEDKTPSMQVYPQTNTVFCFSSNCKLHGKPVDAIDFIMHKENIGKHEALKKAKSLIDTQAVSPIKTMQEAPTKEKNLTEIFKQLQINLGKSQPAKNYLQSRNLDSTKIEIGYNVATIVGLKHCVIFALRNKNNEVTGLYGRSIYNNKDKKHFYLKDSTGLYPSYPHPDTGKLIITESIIDTASLLQIEAITKEYSLLAAYGTNRLNDEMKAAISELKHLKEIIFAFDNDEAGNKAVEKYAAELNTMLNVEQSPSPVERDGVRFSKIELPNKDVNETLVAHNEEVFNHLLKERTFIFQMKKEEEQQTLQIPEQPIKPILTKAHTTNFPTLNFPTLDCKNPYKLIFTTPTALYYIKGGVDKIMNKLNVTIEIVNKQLNESINKRRFKIDLYDNKQIEKLVQEASELLQLNKPTLENDIHHLTEELDSYREKEMQSTPLGDGGETATYQLTPAERSEALQLANDNKIIEVIKNKLAQTGIVGEEENKTFLYIIAASHIQENPLNALIQGSSGSGKTNLLKGIFKTIPEESKKIYSRCSEKMLYNVPKYYFKNKLICFEDVDGLGEEAEYAWRELVSNGELISGVSYKDEKGNIGIKELVVYGPITSIACTTKGAIYADNMSRLFLIAIDESKAQTQRINEYQAKEASGQINKAGQIKAIQQLQNFSRILQPYRVYNPFATKLKLPEGITDERRIYKLYLHFIEIITVLHQYQRKKTNDQKLITKKQDCQIAKDLMFECIMLKMDELDGSLRQFFERLKDHIQKQNNNNYEFTQREIREALHIKKTSLSYYIHELIQLEYVQQTSSHINKGNKYRIIHFDNYRKTREEVKTFLQKQIDDLPNE